jgi:prolyl-tRNA synthetase
MPKVGRFVTDPRAGAYCQITLDGGEKVVVNHEKGGFKGGMLTIEVPRLMGFRSDRIFACDLDSPEG